MKPHINSIIAIILFSVAVSSCMGFKELDPEIYQNGETPVNLSEKGTANCYIVSTRGKYTFNAMVKGSSSELVGSPVSATVLWESFGTDDTIEVEDLVRDVSYSNGWVSFRTSARFQNGNAVIAVKDASGNILWSWHIWLCKDFDPVALAQVYNNNAGTMMDRNLGATSATPGADGTCGLLYQWGRKDPFMGGSDHYTSATSTLSWPSTVSSTSSTGTIAYAVAHPTTFITFNGNNYDWYYAGSSSNDNTRWQTSDKTKGIFDPCPAGWRVPDGGENGVWSKAFGFASEYDNGPWDGTNRGMNFGSGNGKSSIMQLGSASTIWCPAVGYRYDGDGSLDNVGLSGRYWSCTPSGIGAYGSDFYYDGEVSPSNDFYRAYGLAVRCVKDESSQPISEYVDLSTQGKANCYIVSSSGNYKFKATVKGNSAESVGTPASAELLWESFGTNVAPSKGDIVKKISLESSYVKFSTPSTLNNGNAVIAVKDASGNILWSWHIWVCKDFDPKASAQVYNNNAGTMMDRNLGATSATPGDVHALGLLYQWGRKDPFLSGQSISSTTIAASTLSWPGTVSSSSSTGTIAYAVAHPTTFITYNSSNYDWYYTGSSSTDNTRWQTSDKTKGIYDPCPAGWRVPDGGSSGVWSKAFGTSSSWTTSSNWDSTNKGMDFGTTDKTLGTGSIWYPAAGYRYRSDGSLYNVGSCGNHWSCTPGVDYAYDFYFGNNGDVYPSDDYYCRARGRAVRCLSE